MKTYVEKKCKQCLIEFKVLKSEVKRGGGKLCSRKCYYVYQKLNRPTGEKSWAWKGDKVGKEALHNWVQKNLGKPNKCEDCGTVEAKKFEWANISQKYKRDLKDWKRLCTKCHVKFDRKHKFPKWKKSVEKLGWKVKAKT
jgi:hypothetical protein